MIDSPKTWYSPILPFALQDDLLKKYSAIDIDKKYKKLREAKSLSIIAFTLYHITAMPTFINLNEDEPPDGYLMRMSKRKKGLAEILKVEVTHYYKKGSESLLKQLIRTKAPKKPIFDQDYLVVVELRTTDQINYEEIRDYLNDINNPFPVWTIKPLQLSPDTIAEIVIINPKITKHILNVGEIAYRYEQSRIPRYINMVRVANKDLVGYERSDTGEFIKPLWELEIDKKEKL